MPKKEKIKALILAAGESKRLRPLTDDKPKCLLEIGGMAIIDHQLNALAHHGILEVVFVIGYQGDKLKKHIKSKKHPHIFHFIENKNFATTGPAYSLWLAREHFQGDIIYLNSDALFDPKIISEVLNSPHKNVTAIRKNPWDEEQVNVIINRLGRVLEIGKHITARKNHGEFVGVTKLGKNFAKSLIQSLEHFVSNGELKKFAVDAINHALQEFGEKKHIVDVTHLKVIEIDTPEDYKNAVRMWKK